MFIFNEGPAIRSSLIQEFFGLGQGNSVIGAHVYLFKGPVPESIEDIPFNLDHPFEVGQNSIGYCSVQFQERSDLGELQLSQSDDMTGGEWIGEFNSPYLNDTYNKWRVFPTGVVNESSLAEASSTGLTQENIQTMYRYQNSFLSVSHRDTDEVVSGNSIRQFYISPNRYPYADPLIVEFDQEITLNMIHLNQTLSGSIYDNTSMDIQYWDSTLLEGAGDWSAASRLSYSGGNGISIIDVPSMTSNRFRIAGGDTSSRGWLSKSFAFFSDVEPTHEPYDCTWALIGSTWLGSKNLYTGSAHDWSGVAIDDYRAKLVLPWFMTSVGDSTREGGLNLETASAITGKTNLTCNTLRLKF